MLIKHVELLAVLLNTLDYLFECVFVVVLLSNILLLIVFNEAIDLTIQLGLSPFSGLRVMGLFLDLLELDCWSVLGRPIAAYAVYDGATVGSHSTDTQGFVIADHLRVVFGSLGNRLEIGLHFPTNLQLLLDYCNKFVIVLQQTLDVVSVHLILR